MRTFVIASFIFALFAFAPSTLAGSVPSKGSCPGGTSDCAPGLACVSGICENLSPTPANPGVGLVNPLNVGNCTSDTCLMVFLNKILDFVIQIGTIVVILMLVYVGYLFVTARGNDAKITEARQALLWTVVGALILIGAKAISTGIEATVRALSVGK